jgi:hypothetical protein
MTMANHENILVDMLKGSLNTPLVDKLYTGEDFPTTYKTWKTKAICLDDLWQEYQLLCHNKALPTHTTNTPEPKKPGSSCLAHAACT